MKALFLLSCSSLLWSDSGSPVRAANAQNLDAEYSAKIAGISVGEAHVTGILGQASYRIRVVVNYEVLGFSGSFDGAVVGSVINVTGLSPTDYQSSSTFKSPFSGRWARTTTIVFEKGKIAHYTIEPPLTQPEERYRVPLGDPLKEGVVDPISGIVAQLLRASATQDRCYGTDHVFTGVNSFDLKGTAGARTAAGESTCLVGFYPVAGHLRKTSASFVSIVLASRDQTTLKLPDRLEVPLPVGALVVERTR